MTEPGDGGRIPNTVRAILFVLGSGIAAMGVWVLLNGPAAVGLPRTLAMLVLSALGVVIALTAIRGVIPGWLRMVVDAIGGL